jgi:glucokinase
MSGRGAYAIGVDVGGTTIKAGLVGADGKVGAQAVLPSRAGENPGAVLEQAAAAIGKLRESARGECRGAGIGVPGIVSASDGLVRYPPNFAGWGDVDVTGYLSKSTGMRIVTENDANCAALAEARFGAGVVHADFIFVIWGTGVGGGIITGGRIFRGPSGGAGEIGHVSIDRDGPLCRCGNRGCVESYIGGHYLSARAAAVIARENAAGRRSAVLDMTGGDAGRIDPETLSRAAGAGDAIASAILAEAGAMLGAALSAAVNIMDIPVAIIGGGISASPDFVLGAAAEEMRSRVLQPHRASVKVERAKLGNQAGVIGAASLVL